MSNLTRNTIQARGVDYDVRELSGKDMAEIRRLSANSQTYKMEQYVAMTCCVAPKLSQKDVEDLPSFVVTAISDEAFRLSKQAEPGNG